MSFLHEALLAGLLSGCAEGICITAAAVTRPEACHTGMACLQCLIGLPTHIAGNDDGVEGPGLWL